MAERSGILEFTLGLSTGNFLSAIGGASDAVKGFIGGMISLGSIIEGVRSAIDKGAELSHLSRRTGQSIFDLAELEGGFKAAGLAAEEVSPALTMMQRSLGGVNEFGERTDDIFLRMGLRISDLKKMGGLGAFSDIIAALAKLDQNSAMKGAAGIFGRNEGASMVQLSRSTQEFAKGLKDAESTARLFDRDGDAFARWKDHIEALKYPLLELEIRGAEFVVAFTEAWKGGRISELIAVTITAGFQTAVDLLPTILGRVSDVISNALVRANDTWNASVDHTFVNVMSRVEHGIIDKMHGGGPLGSFLKVFTGAALDQDTARNHAQVDRELKQQRDTMDVMEAGDREGFHDKIIAQVAKWKTDMQPLSDMIAGYMKTAKDLSTGADSGELSQSQQFKFQPTALEKMGFVMGGLGMPAMNDLKAIGRETNVLLKQIAMNLTRQAASAPLPVRWLP
jgi:hypothetical protein